MNSGNIAAWNFFDLDTLARILSPGYSLGGRYACQQALAFLFLCSPRAHIRLSKEELIELVPRLQRPEKTSRTSSKQPSTDRKETRENAKPGGAKPGHEGHSRKLWETPDAFEDHAPTHCARCGGAFRNPQLKWRPARVG